MNKKILVLLLFGIIVFVGFFAIKYRQSMTSLTIRGENLESIKIYSAPTNHEEVSSLIYESSDVNQNIKVKKNQSYNIFYEPGEGFAAGNIVVGVSGYAEEVVISPNFF